MNVPIIPVNHNYPRTFTSREYWDRVDGRWVRSEESDVPLNTQLQTFVDTEHAHVVSTSAPSITAFVHEDNRRVYIMGVTVLYIPASEGVVDDKS